MNHSDRSPPKGGEEFLIIDFPFENLYDYGQEIQ